MQNRIKVWDLAVRLFHWSLVALFVSAYLTGEDHDGDAQLHAYLGYAILGLLAFRIAWGFLGTRHARFKDFVCGPARVVRYVKAMLNGTPTHYLGHNPLGGWMVIALLISLSLTCWSGLETYAAEGKGPLARPGSMLINSAIAAEHAREHRAQQFAAIAHAHEAERADDEHEGEGEEFWKELHELFTHLTLLLIVLHITGVVIASRMHQENLVKAMITGYKETPAPADSPQ